MLPIVTTGRPHLDVHPTELRSLINGLASGQVGLVRADQLPGATRRQLQRLVATGFLDRMSRDLYRVAGAPTSWEQCLTAGLWSLGSAALVSHRAGARLWGLDGFDADVVELTVPRLHRDRVVPRLGAIVHSGEVRGLDKRRHRGFPVTSPERTILDLAAIGVPKAALGAAIDSALRLRWTTLDRIIDRRLERRDAGRRGLRLVDAALLDAGGHTVLERCFLRLVREARLPAAKPQVVHRHQGRHVARVDFLFVEHGLVVEVSGGRGHSSPSERAKDARRRNELQQMGRTVLEFTYQQVTQRSQFVVDTLLVSMPSMAG